MTSAAAPSVPRPSGGPESASPNAGVVRFLSRFVAFASLLSIATGLLGVIGRTFGTAAAILLILCGGSLWLLRSREGQLPQGIGKVAGQALAGVVALAGLLSLSEDLVGWDLGVDHLTALEFLLIGLALLWLDWTIAYGSRRHGPSQYLAFLANTGAIVGLLEFILGSSTSYTHVPLQAAVTLFVLSVAVVCARTDRGLGALVASSSYGGMLTRWLWPATIVFPLLIGAAWWMARSAGLFSEWGGITAMIVAMIVLLAGLTVWSGHSIDRSHLERRHAVWLLHRREEALRESEANLKKAQEIAHIGSWHLDVTHDRLGWSDEVFRIFGVPAGTALTYEAFLGAVHPADRDAVDKAWAAAMHGAPYDIEHRIVVNGVLKWVRERAEVEFDRGGRAVKGVGTVQDVTERKRSQEELLRLNRALRALSLCNEALIRAREESTWLDQVCRIIVDEAGYRFCWVGRPEPDDAKSVTPVARAGMDDGYLDAIHVSWGDNERGRGPTGTCIRTGRTQIVRDTSTDPMFAPWRAEAQRRGYASSIAIPLAVDAAPFGALNIYAAETDAFRDQEVALLTELASDMAFGIEALRTRAEREKAEEEIRTLNAELEARVRARTADLEAAREREASVGFRIQQMLLLTQPPTDIPGLQVAALTIPSQRIDGDFYDFYRHENRRLDVIVADVMGKGIPAALLAGATKSNFLEALCHLMAMSGGGALPEPKEIVTLAHADMVRHLIDLESFVTLSYARVDLNRRVLKLVDCGHTGMVVVRAATGGCDIVHGDNLPLGIREGEIFDQVAIPFEAGDMFVFYSDGITDTRNSQGELFGAERLLECVRVNRELEPSALVDVIRQHAVAFAQCARPADDLTCVAVKVVDGSQPLARSTLEIRSDLTELRRARQFVREFCHAVPQKPLEEQDTADLELAVNEAVSNIVKHAYHGRADQRIQLEADASPDRVSIRLHHLGDPFDPAAASPPALDGSRESGFGVYLITHSVDEVRHSRDERGRNCLELVKVLHSERRRAGR